MLYTPNVINYRLSLANKRKLNIFLSGILSDLMLCRYSTLLMQLKICLRYCRKAMSQDPHKRTESHTNLLVTVAVLLKMPLRNSSSWYMASQSCRPLALCTEVESTVCLLDGLWWSQSSGKGWCGWICSAPYDPASHQISYKYQYSGREGGLLFPSPHKLDVQMAWELFSFSVTLLPSESTFSSSWSLVPLFSCHLTFSHIDHFRASITSPYTSPELSRASAVTYNSRNERW